MRKNRNNVKATPGRQLAARVVYAAMKVLKQNGGKLKSMDVASKIEIMLTFNEWEQEVTGKAGITRWESKLHSYTALCTKAGMLIKNKNKGIWELTPAGEEAIKTLDEAGFLKEIEKLNSELTFGRMKRWWYSLGPVSRCTVLSFLVGIVSLSGWIFGILEYLEKKQLYRKQTVLAKAQITALTELNPTVVELEKVEIKAWYSDATKPFVNLLFKNISDLPAGQFKAEIRLSFKDNLPEGTDRSEGYSKIKGHLAYNENLGIAAHSEALIPVAPVKEIRERFETAHPQERFLAVVVKEEDFDLDTYRSKQYGKYSTVTVKYWPIVFDYSYVSVFGAPTKHRVFGKLVSEVRSVTQEDDKSVSESDESPEESLRNNLKK